MKYTATERAHELRNAVVDMTLRYGNSSLALGFAHCNGGTYEGKPVEHWRRTRTRQLKAVMRLSRALRDVEVAR